MISMVQRPSKHEEISLRATVVSDNSGTGFPVVEREALKLETSVSKHVAARQSECSWHSESKLYVDYEQNLENIDEETQLLLDTEETETVKADAGDVFAPKGSRVSAMHLVLFSLSMLVGSAFLLSRDAQEHVPLTAVQGYAAEMPEEEAHQSDVGCKSFLSKAKNTCFCCCDSVSTAAKTDDCAPAGGKDNVSFANGLEATKGGEASQTCCGQKASSDQIRRPDSVEQRRSQTCGAFLQN